jgi:carbon storage regulator
MLVLSRHTGETIQIGEGITVVVLRLGAGQVRIGIEAPNEVVILRGEL